MKDPIISALKEALEPTIEQAVERAVQRKLDSHLLPSVEKEQPPKEVLSNSEAQAFLDASKSTLQRWRNQGVLPYSKVNGLIYYKRNDLLKLVEEYRVNGGS